MWLIIVTSLCGEAIDISMYHTISTIHLEHVTKHEVTKIVDKSLSNVIIIEPTKDLYCG